MFLNAEIVNFSYVVECACTCPSCLCFWRLFS